VRGYKGFEPGMICRGKQYAENTVFEEDTAELCEAGMHFCENPMDVLEYYPLVNDNGAFNEFAEVEAPDGTPGDGKKFCTTKLKIGAKLSFGGFVNACVNFLLEKTKGHTQSGDYARIGSSGDYARIGSSGYYARIGSSGNSARIGSSGYSARIGSSGYSARIGSSGNSARIGSSGNSARIVSTGEDSVICCAGNECVASAKAGSWITLAEWKYNREKERYVPICVKTEYVDGERIKADTPYMLKGGEFVAVE